ncbi:MAG: TIM barrel protein [Bryobacteraceae bacterium]
MSLSRRNLFQNSIVLAAAGALADLQLFARAAADQSGPALSFPTSPRDRLSVTSYPFRAYIDSPSNHSARHAEPRIDMTDFPALIGDRLGVHNINPLIDHFRSTDAAYFARFRKAVTAAGSHVVDLGLPGREFYSPDREVRASAVADGRKWIDMAIAIDSPSVRQHIKGSQGQKADVDLAAESLGEMAEYAAKRKIVVNLENDNPVAEDPFFIVSVIEKAANPYLRALPDFGNSRIGHDADYNKRAITAMLTHVFNMCHVKSVVETKNGVEVPVDLKTMFGLASAASYRGYFCMEFETNGADPFVGTKNLIAETLKYLI